MAACDGASACAVARRWCRLNHQHYDVCNAGNGVWARLAVHVFGKGADRCFENKTPRANFCAICEALTDLTTGDETDDPKGFGKLESYWGTGVPTLKPLVLAAVRHRGGAT